MVHHWLQPLDSQHLSKKQGCVPYIEGVMGLAWVIWAVIFEESETSGSPALNALRIHYVRRCQNRVIMMEIMTPWCLSRHLHHQFTDLHSQPMGFRWPISNRNHRETNFGTSSELCHLASMYFHELLQCPDLTHEGGWLSRGTQGNEGAWASIQSLKPGGATREVT